MIRLIDKKLLTWKEEPDRKPLIVRGARQVGKSFSIRKLGKSFQYFAEINFERQTGLAQIFESDLDPKTIVKKLQAVLEVEIVEGKTLLFLMKYKQYQMP